MKQQFLKFADLLDRFTWKACWCGLAVLSICVFTNIVLRFSFSTGFLWITDLAHYSFGLFVLLSIPCAMRRGQHVRVNLFGLEKAPGVQFKLEWFALFFFLLPFTLLLIWQSLPDVIRSVQMFEGSSQIGGLPGYFLVKMSVPIAALFILIQGTAVLFDANSVENPKTEPNRREK